MYSFEFVVMVAATASIVSIAIGFIAAKRLGATPDSQRQLENHLNELQQQQEQYQGQVSEHFEETASLLNQLTTSYRDVHTHLAKGAQLLAKDGDKEPAELISINTEARETTATPTPITPPLDYAPKTAPNEPGMLNEEFGLEKSQSEQLKERASAEDRM